ncbi:MAG: DnaJ domain-containing protein [Chthoniobacteraceae bacterium]|jgi:curved DNA-binding protein CbpA
MTNLFALLEEPPRPWIDAEALKEKYHQLSMRHHPDVAEGGGDFAEINRAYQTLADPVARLRHLLELEMPEALARTQSVPEEIAEFFGSVAEAQQGIDRFLKKRRAAASPVAIALLSTEQYQQLDRAEEVIAKLHAKQEELLAELREKDALWYSDRAAALGALPRLWQCLSYIAKWMGVLRETVFRLAG